jgi:hypothetical protein
MLSALYVWPCPVNSRVDVFEKTDLIVGLVRLDELRFIRDGFFIEKWQAYVGGMSDLEWLVFLIGVEWLIEKLGGLSVGHPFVVEIRARRELLKVKVFVDFVEECFVDALNCLQIRLSFLFKVDLL